jgi:hypothetical protein
MQKRKKPWPLPLLLVPAAYLAWFLEPIQAYRVVREVQGASDRRDMAAITARCAGSIQTAWRGE